MQELHVGTYERTDGAGLVPLTVREDGTMTTGEAIAAANASFGVRGNGLVYLVDERDEGAINVMRPEGEKWECVARRSTGGSAPCHAALDRHATRLAVTNYESGTVALYSLDRHGLPVEPPALFQCRGIGPNAERQEGPHAHCARFSHGGEGLYVVDLGADRVDCLRLGKGAVFIEAETAWRAPPGTGPRHLVFHPRLAYALALSELASTLTLLDLREGRLQPRQSISTLPPDFAGESLGGHLELNAAGTRVYASNRGHDSIAVFALDDGRLELLQHVPSGGTHPRHFVLLEEQGLLAVAHEKDGRIALFAISADGTLDPRGAGVVVPGSCFLLA